MKHKIGSVNIKTETKLKNASKTKIRTKLVSKTKTKTTIFCKNGTDTEIFSATKTSLIRLCSAKILCALSRENYALQMLNYAQNYALIEIENSFILRTFPRIFLV